MPKPIPGDHIWRGRTGELYKRFPASHPAQDGEVINSFRLTRIYMKGAGVLKLLFVCTGNICRSPIAERLAMAYSRQLRLIGVAATSAGTRAVIGSPIHPLAAQALEELGGDPSGFAARQVTAKIVNSADLILTMTRAHRDTVLELAPRQFQRTFTLCEASLLVSDPDVRSVADLGLRRSQLAGGQSLDIRDPIGHDTTVHADVAQQISTLLQPVLEFIGKD